MKDNFKGSGWFLVALVTCPCHLVLLLPLFAGTAVGLYFEEYRWVIFVLLALFFVLSLYMGWRSLFLESKKETKEQDCCSMKRFNS